MASTVTTLTLQDGPTPISQSQECQQHQINLQPNSLSASSTTQTRGESNTVRAQPIPVLRLRGALTVQSYTSASNSNSSNRRHIHWDESVVNNEGMGKKKSKVCCIYHAPRAFGESSDEDTSSDEDSSSEDDSRNINRNSDKVYLKGSRNGSNMIKDDQIMLSSKELDTPNHKHSHNHDKCSGSDSKGKRKDNQGNLRKKPRSPNAYEKLPKPRNLPE